MLITDVTAYPISFAIPNEHQVRLGIGRTVKRDAVLVKVATDAGITGWGEAHAARAPSAIAELINTTLRQLVTGLDACDPQTVWERVYRMQLASHGAGAAAAIGLSGIDMAQGLQTAPRRYTGEGHRTAGSRKAACWRWHRHSDRR
jgi:L-alanine-DL-glutamate epimerase-like enolase superfamily enzyme